MNEYQKLYAAVDELAAAMKKKLRKKVNDNWGGWESMTGTEITDRIQRQLLRADPDPVDIANFCAFLHHRRTH